MGTAAAVRDRFGLKPWPWVIQAEDRTIKRAAALLHGGEYAAQLAAGWANQGEFTKAVALVDEVLADARRVEKPSRTALLLMVRGVARVYSAHEQARADFAEALSVAQAASDPLALGYVQSH